MPTVCVLIHQGSSSTAGGSLSVKTQIDAAGECARRRAVRQFLLPALLLAVSAGNAVAQTASDSTADQAATRMSVKVNVVNVLATVRDKHGKIVQNLSPDDFILTEDSRPQKLHYFAKESDLPLTLGLLVDTSLSQRTVLDQERSASRGFLDQMVREDQDKAFIIHFDRQAELLQDLTSSHNKLAAALDELETPQLARASSGGPSNSDPDDYPGSGGGRGQRGHWGGGTVLYDSIYLASDELMSKQQGRKALIVLSDGVDRGSKEGLESAIAAAQKANTMVYAIYFKGEEGFDHRGGGFGRRHGGWGGMGGPRIGGPGMGGGGMGRGGGGRYPREEERPDGKKILERIATETGGRLFEVSKKQPVEQIYTSIEEELRNEYNIGFTPDAEGASPGYHKIQLTAKKKDLTVQARQGFYAAE
jgi:VWFA-related protein